MVKRIKLKFYGVVGNFNKNEIQGEGELNCTQGTYSEVHNALYKQMFQFKLVKF